jgi:hypothetical protein
MRGLSLCTLLLLGIANAAYPDTLSIIGVVVKKGADRVQGASVKLYSTSNKTGKPLAIDTASERGVFNLYRTNIAGDLGDLFVVYEGGEGVADPLKVSLGSAKDGLIEVRTQDVVVNPAAEGGALTQEQAADAMASVSRTAVVLVQAGVLTEDEAKNQVTKKTTQILAKVPKANLDIQQLQFRTGTIIKPSEFKGFKLDPRSLATDSIQRAATAAAREGRDGRGGGK